jgi:phosphate:Na+ symporter
MILLVPYSRLIQSIAGGLNPMMQIAVANIIFKTVTTLCFLPFVKQLVALVCRIVPDAGGEHHRLELEGLDEDLTKILPSAAVTASEQAVLRLVDVVRLNLVKTNEYLHKQGTSDDKDEFDKTEAMINRFDQQITEYLIKLNVQRHLTKKDRNDVRFQFDAIKNYERVGDLASNLIEFYQMVFDAGDSFTEGALKEIDEMHSKLVDMFDLSLEIFMTRDAKGYEELLGMEHQLDEMETSARSRHFERMSTGVCKSPVAESVYSDILGTLERMGDHCCNVAKSAVTGATSDLSDDEVIA